MGILLVGAQNMVGTWEVQENKFVPYILRHVYKSTTVSDLKSFVKKALLSYTMVLVLDGGLEYIV